MRNSRMDYDKIKKKTMTPTPPTGQLNQWKRAGKHRGALNGKPFSLSIGGPDSQV